MISNLFLWSANGSLFILNNNDFHLALIFFSVN